MNSASPHITQLIHVPAREKVAETPGYQPGIWGTMCILTAFAFIPGSADSPVALELTIMGALAAIGLGLTGYEIWRHRNRTVLARDGGNIAVFRRGDCDMILAPGEIRMVKAGSFIMIKVGASLGIAAILFSSIGIFGLLNDEAATADNLVILGLGLTCGASLASAARTRFFCCHLRIPIKGSNWREESVLVSCSRMKELFPEIMESRTNAATIV